MATYEIVHVPHDDASIRAYLQRYKAFRLLSLQIAPEAFRSTHAQESAFTDDVWYERLANPSANTFFAVQRQSEIVSASTLLGPLTYGTDELSVLGNPWVAMNSEKKQQREVDRSEPLHFRLNAIFTLPEARRQGISRSLILEAVSFASSAARAAGSQGFVVSVVVEADNPRAIALYEGCAFTHLKEVQVPNHRGSVLLLERRHA